MRITVDEAREYFSHPSQHEFGKTEKDLPEWGDYWAKGGVCLVSHNAYWPGIVMVHVGAKPEAWGGLDEDVRSLLAEIWAAEQPTRMIAWISENNRAALALARRVGFEIDGYMPNGVVLMGWKG